MQNPALYCMRAVSAPQCLCPQVDFLRGYQGSEFKRETHRIQGREKPEWSAGSGTTNSQASREQMDKCRAAAVASVWGGVCIQMQIK